MINVPHLGKIAVVTVITTVIVCMLFPTQKDKAGEPEEASYYAYRYQLVVYIAEGRVTAGPEKFGVVKCHKIDLGKLAEKFPKRDEDKPAFAQHATDKIVEVPVFSNFTPITKEQYDIATKSKALSVNLE